MEEDLRKSQPPLKKTRARNPRSRTGCLTCKTRRLKCDEAKPICTRCSSGLRNCIWKEEKAPEPAKLVAKPIRLLPKQSAAVIPQPAAVRFYNDREWQYFWIYTKETARELAGAYPSAFWSQIVLQAAHHHAFIRSAVIAIGSFASLARAMDAASRNLPGSGNIPANLKQFALAHYQRFVVGIKHLLTTENQTTRLSLISCLLVICLENLQWNYATAVNSVWAGIKLLNDWLRAEQPRARGKLSRYSASPNTLVVEDGILRQFHIYDYESAWICDRRPLAMHKELRFEGEETVQRMPTLFTDLDEARSMFNLISQRIHHFIVSIRPEKLGVADFTSMNGYGSCRITLDREQLYDPLTLEQQKYQSFHSQEIKRWEIAFAALSQTTTEDSPRFIGVNLLRIQALALLVRLFGELSTSEMIYDHFLQTFKDIIKLSKAHFNHADVRRDSPRGVNSINNGILYPIHFIAYHCRDRIVRREAIALLTNKPWREGIVFSLAPARTGTYLMEEEERDLETYEIPEERRLVIFEICYVTVDDVLITCTKSARGLRKEREVLVQKWEWAANEIPWVPDKKSTPCEIDYLESRIKNGRKEICQGTPLKE